MKKKGLRITLIALASIVVVLTALVQIFLNSTVLTRTVNGIAGEIIPDAKIRFSKVDANIFRSFPYLKLSIDDFSITYPHERFCELYGDTLSLNRYRRRMILAGSGEQSDTLASFKRLDFAVNYMTIFSSHYDIRRLSLIGPKIYAHRYDSLNYNWDVLEPLFGGESSDTSSTEKAIRLTVGNISFEDNPKIVYTDAVNSVQARVKLRNLSFDGDMSTSNLTDGEFGIRIDTMSVMGRFPGDTIFMRMSRLRAMKKGSEMSLDMKAAVLASALKRQLVPVELKAMAKVEDNVVDIESCRLRLAPLVLNIDGEVCLAGDSLDVRAVSESCSYADIADFSKKILPELSEYSSDAEILLSAEAKGSFANAQMPLSNAFLKIKSSEFNADASVRDLFGEDPRIKLVADGSLNVEKMLKLVPESGIEGKGQVDLNIRAKAKLSQLSADKIGNADIEGKIFLKDIDLQQALDTVQINIPSATLSLGTRGNILDSSMPKGARVLAGELAADFVSMTMGSGIVEGQKLNMSLQNSAKILKGINGKKLTPLLGSLNWKELKYIDGMTVRVNDAKNTFRIIPSSANTPAQRLEFSNRSGFASVHIDKNRLMVRELRFDASASEHQSKARQRRNRQNEVPEWLQDEDFKKKDLNLRLDESLSEYFREWDFNGRIQGKASDLYTPRLPLRVKINYIDGRLDNNSINIDRLELDAGRSNLSISLGMKGLRRMMLGKGRLKVTGKIASDSLDADQLLAAIKYGAERAAKDEAVSYEDALKEFESKEEYESDVIVIPSNLEADIDLDFKKAKWSNLVVDSLSGNISTLHRTLKISDVNAATSVGDIDFDGFYSSVGKENISAGFDLRLKEMATEKVIDLFPAIDTLMPLLNSLRGNVNCSIAATTNIDCDMNIIIPSLSGVMNITGTNLSIKDSREFTKIARLLMFNNAKSASIDSISVNGIINDNMMNIYPFVIKMDRYALAASGRQTFDESYRYHVSVIKSPILFKFGIDAYGKADDKMHLKIRNAKYRSTDVPAYSEQMSEIRLNVVESIRNIFGMGVEKAMESNASITENHRLQFEQAEIKADEEAQNVEENPDLSLMIGVANAINQEQP